LRGRIAPTLLFNLVREGVEWQDSFKIAAQALGQTEPAQKVITDNGSLSTEILR